MQFVFVVGISLSVFRAERPLTCLLLRGRRPLSVYINLWCQVLWHTHRTIKRRTLLFLIVMGSTYLATSLLPLSVFLLSVWQVVAGLCKLAGGEGLKTVRYLLQINPIGNPIQLRQKKLRRATRVLGSRCRRYCKLNDMSSMQMC